MQECTREDADYEERRYSDMLSSRTTCEKQLIFFVSLVLIYVLAIPYFGFTLSSGTFLIISILNLWDKGFVWSLGVSVFSIAVIYFLFRIVFQVILPSGSFWS